MKKIIVIAIGLIVALGAVSPAAVQAALTESQIQAILSLLTSFGADSTTVANVNASLRGTTPPAGGTTACTGVTFTRNLTVGSSGSDVKCLQAILNSSAATQVAASGPGSAGQETTYFGPLTQAGVVKFQTQYAISPAVGYVGSLTRAQLTTVLGGGVVPPPPGAGCATAAEGTYTVTLAATPAGGTVTAGAGLSVYGIDIKAIGSDITVGRLDLQIDVRTAGVDALFNTADDVVLNPSTLVTKVALYDGATLLKEKTITSSDVTLDSAANVYYVRTLDFSFVVPKDTIKTLTAKVDTTTSIDLARQITVQVYGANGIRGRDCKGIDTYFALITPRVYTINIPGQGTLTASVSTNTPSTQNVYINPTDGVQNVPLLVFSLKSTVGDTVLTRFAVQVSTVGIAASNVVPTIVKLYDGDTLVSSANPNATGIATFETFRLTVAKDATKTMTAKGDFAALGASGTNIVTFPGGLAVPATSANSIYERANGAIVNTTITGGITGNNQYLYEQGVKITFLGGTNTVTTNGLGHATATGILTFKAEPFGGTMTKPTYATATSGATNQISVLSYTAGGVRYVTPAVISAVVATNPDQAIPDGGSATITVTMLATDDGTTDVGLMMFKVEEIFWEVGTVIAQQGYGTGNLTDNWKTPYANLGG